MANLHLSLKGHTAWELLEDDRVVKSGAYHNLITNKGLDDFGTASSMADWRYFMALGTGSAAPDITQYSLSNEVIRTSSSGVFQAESAIYGESNGLLYCEHSLTRVASFNSSYNITEYGLGKDYVQNVGIRELFRDSNGQPIVISVNSGQQLKVTHTIRLSLSSALQNKTTIIEGLGNFQSVGCWYSSYNLADLFAIFMPQGSCSIWALMTAQDRVTGEPNIQGAYVTSKAQPYVNGEYKRIKRGIFDAGLATGKHYGYAFDSSSNGTAYGGYKEILVNPDSIDKDATKKLTIDLVVSWGRG